jgi:Ni/Fe-hydrogenase subunit HybB-like protein
MGAAVEQRPRKRSELSGNETENRWTPLRHRWGFRMTPFRILLVVVAAVFLLLVAYRFVYGIGVVTNLTDRWPWALWTWWKLTGVALAGAGYSTNLCIYFFGRERWHDVERGAFTVSMLGYLMVCAALLLDLGQWYNAWHPFVSWGYHSVMFELFFCVGGYTVIQVIEFLYIFEERVPFPKLRVVLKKIYAPVLCTGMLLPFFHQSALNTLYVIAKGREDPLWWSMLLPIFAICTSMFVGPAVVTIENFASRRTYGRPVHLPILGEMVRIASGVMFVYLCLKIADYTVRGVLPELFGGSLLGNIALIELVLLTALPMAMFMSPGVRASEAGMLWASWLTVGGVVLNRFNITITGMMASTGEGFYYPSWMEVWFCLGMAASVVLAYLFIAENFPIYTAEDVAVADARRRSRRPTTLRRRPDERGARAA